MGWTVLVSSVACLVPNATETRKRHICSSGRVVVRVALGALMASLVVSVLGISKWLC